jgi:hypothetical protein
VPRSRRCTGVPSSSPGHGVTLTDGTGADERERCTGWTIALQLQTLFLISCRAVLPFRMAGELWDGPGSEYAGPGPPSKEQPSIPPQYSSWDHSAALFLKALIVRASIRLRAGHGRVVPLCLPARQRPLQVPAHTPRRELRELRRENCVGDATRSVAESEASHGFSVDIKYISMIISDFYFVWIICHLC